MSQKEISYDVNIIGMGGPDMKPAFRMPRTLTFEIESGQLSARIHASDGSQKWLADKLLRWAAEMEQATRPSFEEDQFPNMEKPPASCINCAVPKNLCPKSELSDEKKKAIAICEKLDLIGGNEPDRQTGDIAE